MVMGYRDDPEVLILDDLILPMCDVCGDIALDLGDTIALDAALERSYQWKRPFSSGDLYDPESH
ncbi:MAG TPA: hypothetical protein VFT45_14175 [Longimicrobium sp.]|nr:hypothetical protein [Longimicrobium sp.]